MILRKILREPAVIALALILLGLVVGTYLGTILPAYATETEEKQASEPQPCRIAGLRMPVFTRELAPLMPVYRYAHQRLAPLREELGKVVRARDVPARCPSVRLPIRPPRFSILYA